eukprot:scaffold46943_cov191-Amphora_coffeaeformis.AAC.1
MRIMRCNKSGYTFSFIIGLISEDSVPDDDDSLAFGCAKEEKATSKSHEAELIGRRCRWVGSLVQIS